MVSIHQIAAECGLNIISYEQVPGGDINLSYCLHEASARYFLKVNDSLQYPEMFAKEAHGLQELNQNTSLKVPQVIRFGTLNEQQFLLMEYLEKGG